MRESDAVTEKGKAVVILLSGFLGSGKTTLLKRILSWETDLSGTMVMVNEFGEVGIDGALLKGSGSDVVELASGCICCTMSADMSRSLEDILHRFHPKRILIEASGVADPSAIVSVLDGEKLRKRLTMDRIITVLDADFWEAREAFGPLFYNQLQMAHLILLNKVDLLKQSLVPQFLDEIHQTVPGCKVVPTIRCQVDPDTLWAESKAPAFGFKPMAFYESASTGGHCSPTASEDGLTPVDASHYVTFSFQSDDLLNEDCFKAFMSGLPLEVFRVKGPVCFPDRISLVNHVGGQTEWSQWSGVQKTQLAFIGWNINSDDTLGKLKECVIR